MALDFEALVLGPCLGAFGEDVSYLPVISDPDAPPQTLSGIFNRAHQIVDMDGDGVEHHSTSPTLGINPSQWPDIIKSGDQVTVRGELFEVFGPIQPDGKAGALMFLKKVIL